MYKPPPKQLTIKKSPIEGLGLYATEDIKKNLEDVFYHLQEKSDAKYMFLITIQDVKAGDEITANYNIYTYPKTGIGIQSF